VTRDPILFLANPERAVVRSSSPLRVTFANARLRPTPPRDSPRLALGVGTPTLLPLMLTFVKDDGWLRLSPELFIVLRTPSPLARRRKCTADKIIDT
jgi:hypothetical protein